MKHRVKIVVFTKSKLAISLNKLMLDMWFNSEDLPQIRFVNFGCGVDEIQGIFAEKLVFIGEDANESAWKIYKDCAVFV